MSNFSLITWMLRKVCTDPKSAKIVPDKPFEEPMQRDYGSAQKFENVNIYERYTVFCVNEDPHV